MVKRMASPLQIRTLVSLPFDENSYVVWLAGRNEALVIDPGFEPDLILDCLREEQLSAAASCSSRKQSRIRSGSKPGSMTRASFRPASQTTYEFSSKGKDTRVR